MGQRSRKLGAVGVLGLAGVLGWFLSRCGMGVPGGSEAGSDPAAAPEEVAAPDEPLTVVVIGDRCRFGREKAQLCSTMCDPIREAARDRDVIIEGSQGSHGVVLKVRKCLEDAGHASVTVKSD